MNEEGKQIWIPSKPQAWELGTIISVDNEKGDVTVKVEGEEETRTMARSDTHQTDPSHFEDSDDLCSMNHLHEAPLLDCLRRRFSKDIIYTTTGDVLISVNPYKTIPGLYDKMLSFLDVPEDGLIDKNASKPHVFKIANYALMQMLNGITPSSPVGASVNQSIVVSGESGAGKTETAKRVMSFLTEVDRELNREKTTEALDKVGDSIKKVLLESNIIFESFGNAKTVRNDNSSRFGKYIKLQYSDDNRLMSAFTETFLLEKSRLMSVGERERNYHIFYEMLEGMDDVALRERLCLKEPDQFKMLLDVAGNTVVQNDAANFPVLCKALLTVGCTEEELAHLWTLMASLLHMGNLICTMPGDEGGGGTAVSASEAVADRTGTVQIASASVPMEQLSEFLGVPLDMFMNRLVMQRVRVSTRRSVTVKVLSLVEVQGNIAALIKWIYSAVFSWLVRKINFAHCSVTSDTSMKAEKFIGILDIFGFEILVNNSFEQLCINFTNERLQQQFNEYVFDREQTIYKEEGLDWETIGYRDNQHVIDLIGKKPTGLLPILEEQGRLNRGSADEGALVSSFNNAHDKKSAAYEKSRFLNDGKFTVKHFAGNVTYTVTGFLEKNNDALMEDLMDLMYASSNVFIQNAIVSALSGDMSAASLGDDDDSTTAANAAASAPALPGFVGAIASNMLPPAPPIAASTRASISGSPEKPSSSSSGGGGGGKKMASTVTVSYQFRAQLDALQFTLRQTVPHYIKCIKPNTQKVPGSFNGPMVLEQLRYSGALEVVRIRREGFAVSMPFKQLYETFALLSPGAKSGWANPAACTPEQAREYCKAICEDVNSRRETQAAAAAAVSKSKVDSSAIAASGTVNTATVPSGYQLGHTKAFLRNDFYESLMGAIVRLQNYKASKLQALVRMKMAKKSFTRSVRQVRLIQTVLRRFTARSRFLRVLAAKREADRIAAKLEAERQEQERRAAEEAERKRLKELARVKAEEEAEQARLEAERRKKEEENAAEQARIEAELEAEQRRIQEEQQAEMDRIEAIRKREEEVRQAEAARLAAIEAEMEAIRLAEVARVEALEKARIEKENRVKITFECAKHGELVAVVTRLGKHPEDFNARSSDTNETLIHCAAQGANVSLLQYLSPTTDELNAVDNENNTTAHAAVACTNRGSDSVLHLGGNKVAVLRYLSTIIDPLPGASNRMAHKAQRLSTIKFDREALRKKIESFQASDTAAYSSAGVVGQEVSRATQTMSMRMMDRARENELELEKSAVSYFHAKKPTLFGFGASSSSATAANSSAAIKSGWLSKRGESSKWQKRWVVLTNDCLMYFHNEKDRVPRDSMSFATQNDIKIERVKNVPTALDITINSHSVKKSRDRISFMAGSEEELQEWMSMLKAVAGVVPTPLRDTAVKSLYALNPALHVAYFNATNAKSESVLHILARQHYKAVATAGAASPPAVQQAAAAAAISAATCEGEDDLVTAEDSRAAAEQAAAVAMEATAASTPGPLPVSGSGPLMVAGSEETADNLLAAAWLIGRGVSVNAMNNECLTPLLLALQYDNYQMALLLARKGGNPSARNLSATLGKAAASKLSVHCTKSPSPAEMWLLTTAYQNSLRNEGVCGFKKPPPRLRGFTYLSLIILSQTIRDKELFLKPDDYNRNDLSVVPNIQYSLRATVVNINNLVVEPHQTSAQPWLVTGSATTSDVQSWLWLDTFHMQIPLDNVEDGSYIIIQLLRCSAAAAAAAAAMGLATNEESTECVAWLRINLDKNAVDSEVLSLPFRKPPYVMQSEKEAAVGDAEALVSATSHLNVEMNISTRNIKDTRAVV